MKRSNVKKEKLPLKVIGCGAVGLCVLNVLARWLSYQEKYDVELQVIDGDSYEEKNRPRQAFVKYGNKAEVTAESLREQFGNFLPWITASSVYLNKENVLMLLREGDVVFSCVDNHATRKLISDRAEELEDVVVISGGNEYTDGNAQIHVRRGGKDITLPVANKFHKEIMAPTDKNPGERDASAGCGVVVQSAPQLLFTNHLVSALMLNAFYAFTEGRFSGPSKPYDEVYGDVLTNKVLPRLRN